MCAFTEFAVEAVTIQQGEPDLEVLFLAVVGRCSHQQKMPGYGAQHFTELEPLGFVDLVAKVIG